MSYKTVEAIYENGLLRPLEQIDHSENERYFVVVIRDENNSKRLKERFKLIESLFGVAKNSKTSSSTFAARKKEEKRLEAQKWQR